MFRTVLERPHKGIKEEFSQLCQQKLWLRKIKEPIDSLELLRGGKQQRYEHTNLPSTYLEQERASTIISIH